MAKAKFDFESVWTKDHNPEQIRQIMVIIVVNFKLVLLPLSKQYSA